MIDLAVLQGSSLCRCSAWRAPAWRRSRALLAARRRRRRPGTTTPRRARPRRRRARRSPIPRPSTGRRSTALVISPGVPQHACPSRIRWPRAARAAGVPIIGDIELLRARPSRRRAVRRHHRHQRQVDHHRADRPYPRRRRRAAARSAAISAAERSISEPLPEGGVYVLELSSYQLDLTADLRVRRRGAAQHHARPSRPPWRHGGLCRRQGAHLRPPAGRATAP